MSTEDDQSPIVRTFTLGTMLDNGRPTGVLKENGSLWDFLFPPEPSRLYFASYIVCSTCDAARECRSHRIFPPNRMLGLLKDDSVWIAGDQVHDTSVCQLASEGIPFDAYDAAQYQ